jgi:hypothetical protein
MDKMSGLRVDLLSRPSDQYHAIAFIGTRRVAEVTNSAVELFLGAARAAVAVGFAIRTGAARGADQLAAHAALSNGGRVELVLPWANYESAWRRVVHELYPGKISEEVYNPAVHVAWGDSVVQYHPNPQALTPAARALHARNYGIVEPAAYVVALAAPDRKGGTEQGIRIGQGLRKLVRVVEDSRIRYDDDSLLTV